MSILIKGMEIPKSCYECKLDLRSDVCSAFCEWNAEHPYSIRATDRLPGCPLSEVPECEDAVSRTDALKFKCDCYDSEGHLLYAVPTGYILRLKPVTPKQRTGHWIPVGMVEVVGGESAQWGSAIAHHKCSECNEQALRDDFEKEVLSDFCPHCGAMMRGTLWK